MRVDATVRHLAMDPNSNDTTPSPLEMNQLTIITSVYLLTADLSIPTNVLRLKQ